MPYVTTDAGAYLAGKPHRTTNGDIPGYTQAEAESDAADRNRRAAELGIKTRYVVVDD